jgi:hypothetical protein
VAGQFSLYAAGPPSAVLLAAPYDQFFKKDYDPIMQVNRQLLQQVNKRTHY